jgi:uncharacterized repeat protein (TIGR01451 family)
MTVTPVQDVKANDMLTYTLTLKNTGLVDDPMITTTNTLPHILNLDAVDLPSRGNVMVNGETITWTTSLSKNETAILTYRARIKYEVPGSIENTAYAVDNINEPLALKARTAFKVFPYYFPIIFKN